MTHEDHRARHAELYQALTDLLSDWLLHHLLTTGRLLDSDALLAQPIDGLVRWAYTQSVEPTPLPWDALHDEAAPATAGGCDAACVDRFLAGHHLCRHLRTQDEAVWPTG
jgi:hypothetical protein